MVMNSTLPITVSSIPLRFSQIKLVKQYCKTAYYKGLLNMAKAQKQSVNEHVYESMKERIIQGVYPPNMHLVEADLTREFQVSRITIREALLRLLSDELVDSIPNRGVFVHRLSLKEMLEIYSVREYLEGFAARLVTEFHDPALLDKLADVVHLEKRSVEENDYMKHKFYNARIHEIIKTGSKNDVLIKSLNRLNSQMIASQSMNIFVEIMAESHQQHVLILETIQSGDSARAEKVMRWHLNEAKHIIKREYERRYGAAEANNR